MPRKTGHRKIYLEHHGYIPDGYHIHHKDGNHANNDIDNLEALHPDEHAQRHGYISNWVMAQERASRLGVEKLKTPEIRKKMSEAMKNSKTHAAAIKRRSKNKQWQQNVAAACRETAKNRTNEVWNKGKTGLQTHGEETRKLMTEQRTGRKWYNDGDKTYFIHPENKLPHYKEGRI